MKKEKYLQLKKAIIDAGYGREIKWSESICKPKNPFYFWLEYTWVVCCSGMKEQIARNIFDKIIEAYKRDQKAIDVFNHKGKAQAIDHVWEFREKIYEDFLKRKTNKEILYFLKQLPFIGEITNYHLAKNLGINIAKPDRWLIRIAEMSKETVQELCERLSHETGDKVVTVDSVIWRACNLGLAGDMKC